MNFSRFNHILIPQHANQRIDWLNSKRGAWLRLPYYIYLALTPFGRFLVIFWMFSLTMGMNMEQTVCYVVSSVITGLFVASFAVKFFFTISDVEVKAMSPPRAIAGTEMEFTLSISNNSHKVYQAIDVEPPFLTWDGKYTKNVNNVETILPGQRLQTRCSARFEARGAHSLMPFAIRQTAPLGITTGKTISSNLVNFLIAPRFPRIAHLSVPLTVRCQPGGVAMASQIGEARELVGVRPYRPGDRLKDVHAKTWAKTGVPHVREYHQEYFSRIGLVLDTDTKNGAIKEREFEAAVSLAAGCLAHLSKNEALIDIIVVGNKLSRLTMGRNLGFLDQALDLLATVKPGGSMDREYLQARLDPLVDRLSAMVFVCLDVSQSHEDLSRWVSQRGVPVLRILIKKEGSKGSDDSVKTVSSDQVYGDKALYL